MKRKVIRQGNNTLTITLPHQWATANGVKAGDELDVQVRGMELAIASSLAMPREEVGVDVSGMDGSSIVLLIRGLYRKGYDRITVRSSDTHVRHVRAGMNRRLVDVVTAEVNRLMGFEIFDQTKNSFDVRSVSTEIIEDFDTVLRRIFMLTNTYYDDFERALRENDAGALTELIEKPDSITKLISYSTRALNKKGYAKPQYTIFLYHLIESLELINDSIKNAVRYVHDNHIDIGKNGLKIIADIGKLLKEYNEIYYKWSLKRFSDYNRRRDGVIADVNGRFGSLSKGELSAIIQLRMILDIIRESLRLRSSLL